MTRVLRTASDGTLPEPKLNPSSVIWFWFVGCPPTENDAALESVAADFPLLAAALRKARPVAITGHLVVVAFPYDDSFNRRMAAENGEHRRAVAEALHALTGVALRVDYELHEFAEELSGDELVARIVQEFDAEEIVAVPESAPDQEAGT